MSGMFGEGRTHAKYKSVEWYTPLWVFEMLGIRFALDPCSPYDIDSFVPADKKYTIYDNGLNKPWDGRVWLNPPYGKETSVWMRRMIAHGNGIALVFSRTDVKWCQEAMKTADAMLFIAGRIAFVPGKENAHKKSTCGAGSVMFAWGQECADALRRLSDRGVLICNGL